jgi:uncharacterized lipoprotein YbaY/heat shock protein HslJ
MKAESIVTSAIISTLLCTAFACSPDSVGGIVSGSATYRERMALPPGAVLEVSLQDVSQADAPAVELGSVRVEDPGNPPFEFEIPYDHGAIDERLSYSVRATIRVDDTLLFTTDTHYPVLTRGAGDVVELLLVRAAALPQHAAMNADDELRGMYVYMADAALFTDCETGDRYPVAFEGDSLAVERAYLEARRQPGEELLISLEGHFAERPAMEGGDMETSLVVDRFIGVWPGETCGARGTVSELLDNYWKLTRLGDDPVVLSENQREPHLVLRSMDGRAQGFGGCNIFAGSFEIDGDSITFGHLGTTAMACPNSEDVEMVFMAALAEASTFRLMPHHLEMFDGEGHMVARFEARELE